MPTTFVFELRQQQAAADREIQHNPVTGIVQDVTQGSASASASTCTTNQLSYLGPSSLHWKANVHSRDLIVQGHDPYSVETLTGWNPDLCWHKNQSHQCCRTCQDSVALVPTLQDQKAATHLSHMPLEGSIYNYCGDRWATALRLASGYAAHNKFGRQKTRRQRPGASVQLLQLA